MRPGGAGLALPLLWLSSPAHEQGTRGLNTNTGNGACPGPTSRNRQGWPSGGSPGGAEGTGYGEAPPPFPGETARAAGTPRTASGLTFSGSESLQVHPLTLTRPPGSRAGPAATGQKTKARKQRRVCQEQQSGPQGAVWEGQQPPPSASGQKSPARPGAFLEAQRCQHEAFFPTGSRGPATGQATPHRRLRPAKASRVPRPGREDTERFTPVALLPLQTNNTPDPRGRHGAECWPCSAHCPTGHVSAKTRKQPRRPDRAGPWGAWEPGGHGEHTPLQGTGSLPSQIHLSLCTPGRHPERPAVAHASEVLLHQHHPRPQRRAETPVSRCPSHRASDADS